MALGSLQELKETLCLHISNMAPRNVPSLVSCTTLAGVSFEHASPHKEQHYCPYEREKKKNSNKRTTPLKPRFRINVIFLLSDIEVVFTREVLMSHWSLVSSSSYDNNHFLFKILHMTFAVVRTGSLGNRADNATFL